MEQQTTPTALPSVERPWLKYYSEQQIAEPLPTGSLYELLIENNNGYPHDIAIHYLGKSITYGEMINHIEQCAKAFTAIGVRRGDIVTVAMPNTPEMVYASYALNRIGAIINIIHPLAGEEETCRYINEVESRVVLMFTGTYAFMKNALHKTTATTAIVTSPAQSLSAVARAIYNLKNIRHRIPSGGNILTWQQFIALGNETPLPAPCRAPGDHAIISHTGGTTGTAKGVVCTNLNFASLGQQMLSGRGSQRQDGTMILLPPFINYSYTTLFDAFTQGHRTLLIPKYNPMQMAHYIHKYRIAYLLTIPAYLKAMLKIKRIPPQAFASLKTIVSGGETLDEQTENAINRQLTSHGSPVVLEKGTGMTELTSGGTATYPSCNIKGSVGVPYVKTNCKIVSTDDGHELSYNQEGEVCFSGTTVMWGYYNNPEATAEIITTDSDGIRWLHTGDIGYMNEDGVVFLTGRMKRLIMQKDAGGMVSKISPERIEQAISKYPAVATCCVVGIADTARIARPVAVVELIKSQTASPHLKEEIINMCATTLPQYMVPTEIIIIETMPRTSRGKIDYRAVEQMVSGE